MMVRLTAVLSAALLVAACGGKKDNPENQQVQPADQGEQAAAPAEGGAQAEAPEAARAGGVVAGAAKTELSPATTTSPNAVVSIVEISDFQCPFCSRVLPTLDQLKKEYGDQIKITFLHNALPFHPQAKPAAAAAVAADKQGKFWEMHDKLFQNQKQLANEDLERYAKEIGLDMEQYKKDIADPAVSAFIDQNQAIANALGARGTPSFFINGKNLRGAQPVDEFKKLIDPEIEAAKTAGKKGDEYLKERTKANNSALYDYLYAGKEPPKTPARPPAPVDRTVYKVTVDPKVDAIQGPVDAPVTIVEFSEFQCPFCKKILPTSKQIKEEYGDKVRFVFKHNPLPFHKQAMPASEAAMCAGEQGKFWEMHGVLFENQRALNDPDLEKYATDLGLDMGKWKACFTSGKFKEQILADQELAVKVTARGTPNTFINGRKITGAKPFEEFKEVIDEELKKAEAMIAKGTDKAALYDELIKDGKVFEPLEEKVNEFNLDGSPMKGKQTARIQIVEFSDFQCPFCSRITKPLEEAKEHYGDDLVVVFKHFPLSFHKEALPAATASMCAMDQGKFWEYHDKLFQNQKALADEQLKAYAGEIGLDQKKFDECLASDKHKAKIEEDMAEARRAGVRGTPTVYINGRKFNPPSGYNKAAFTSVIDKYVLGKAEAGE